MSAGHDLFVDLQPPFATLLITKAEYRPLTVYRSEAHYQRKQQGHGRPFASSEPGQVGGLWCPPTWMDQSLGAQWHFAIRSILQEESCVVDFADHVRRHRSRVLILTD